MYQGMLQSDLIDLHCQAVTHTDLFHQIGKELKEKGWVTEDYVESLLERERVFPTGLQTRFVNIALPHTDPHVIEKPFIYIVKNETPITMLQMGDNAETLCHYFLFLGIKDPKSQVGLLSALMELFADEAFVNQFVSIADEKQMYELVEQKLSQ